MRPLYLLGLLLFVAPTLSAQSIFDLISGEAEVRTLSLELPLDSIYDKTDNRQDALLEFVDDTGLAQRWPLHVGVRGKFRRRTCTLPPLRLDFKKDMLASMGMSRHDKLKLVVPCQDEPGFQNLVLREYLAYQIYADLTPYHYRTQLLELTLTDVNDNWPDQTVYAFVLEDTDEMAERIGGEEVDNLLGQQAGAWDRDAEVTHSLIQYLIGNHDYSLPMVRNLKQVRMHNSGLLVPVGYDFDFSQLVYAPYATINTYVGQRQFTDRVYLGFSAEDDLLREALARFAARRGDILRMLRNTDLLDNDERFAIVERISTGFNQLRRLTRANSNESIYARLRGEQADSLPAGGTTESFGRK